MSEEIFRALCAAIGDETLRPPNDGFLGRSWGMIWKTHNGRVVDGMESWHIHLTADGQRVSFQHFANPGRRELVESVSHLHQLLGEIR